MNKIHCVCIKLKNLLVLVIPGMKQGCREEELVISTQDFPNFQEEWIHVRNQSFLTRKASTFNLDL